MPARFSGHETFACRYAWLPKALQAIREDRLIFADEDRAMVELGVGKNMVRSIRFWVEASGMAELAEGGGLRPSWLGNLIFGSRGLDPYMEDIQTLWLIHWNLSTHVEDPLFAWQFLFGRWQEPEFTESGVLKAFMRDAETHKRLSEVTVQQHLQVFLHTYVPTRGKKGEIAEDNLDCPLTELEIVVKVGDREGSGGQSRGGSGYAFRNEDKPGISAALFSYCVDDFWRKTVPNEQTLSVRSLVNALGSPGQTFKIPEESIYARLVDLESVSDHAFQYHESAALPQVHRVGQLKREDILTRAYQ